MIWAAIWGGGHTEIYRMNRDEESARRGYSSRSSLRLNEDYLPDFIWESGMVFMQENGPIHTANIIS
ncbi:uncharacterized protein EURHEDRAFT_410355, partial [Aspergillus ruber CBS 135680]